MGEVVAGEIQGARDVALLEEDGRAGIEDEGGFGVESGAEFLETEGGGRIDLEGGVRDEGGQLGIQALLRRHIDKRKWFRREAVEHEASGEGGTASIATVARSRSIRIGSARIFGIGEI